MCRYIFACLATLAMISPAASALETRWILRRRAFLTDQRVASPYRSAASRAGDPAPPPLP